MRPIYLVRYSTGGYANRRHHELELRTLAEAQAKAQALVQAGYPSAVYEARRLSLVVDSQGYYLDSGTLIPTLGQAVPPPTESAADAEAFPSFEAAQAVACQLNERLGRAEWQAGPVVTRRTCRLT